MLKYTLLIALTISLQAKHLHKEKFYADRFCASVGGMSEFYLRDKTVADCMTKHYAIEVEFAEKFYQGIGQALHYSIVSGRKPAVYLIIENRKDYRYLDRLERIAEKYDIKVFYYEEDSFINFSE